MKKLFTITLIAIAGLATLGAGRADAGPFVPRIEGTWEITGTPDPSPCGPAGSFVNLGTITRDGKLINVDPLLGSSVGEVYRLGRNRYAIGFFGFLPGPTGILRYEVQATGRSVNPGEFKGRFRTIVTDPSGAPVCTYTGTVAGTRLVPMPF